ncbi:MAG: ribonuclease J [Deltaproteobacteria bacterium]|nr:MAG: ribonuclease J [Deltaproteobacteria bacterium]
MLKIVPLGGLGEIGLNMMTVEYDDSIIIIDCGLMFPEDYMLGVDIVIPDFAYIRENSSRIIGVVLTHAHEDHIGGVPFLLRELSVPVFATPFTLGIVGKKLEDSEVPVSNDLRKININESLELGPFTIHFIRVSHSTIDGAGMCIETPLGRIIHTGDFKINTSLINEMSTDINKFARFGEKGVLCLLSDSTNVEKQGYTISEMEVGESLENLISESSGRIIVALFASNIARIQQIVNIGRKYGKKVAFNGRSIETTVKVAKENGFLRVPGDMEIGIEDVNYFKNNSVIIITTGSQGEPMSALARMADGVHRQINIKRGDTVILSSKFIPGNEKAITQIINNLYKFGANVIYEKIANVHVSGHAYRGELEMMINLVKPQFFMPIHGEYRHLFHHAELARSMGISENNVLLVENGQEVIFDESGGNIGMTVPTGRVLIDGKGIGDVGRSLLKERRVLSEDGIAIVTMIIDEETGAIVYGPELESRGFVFCNETGHLLQDAQCVILEIVEDIDSDLPERILIIKSRLQKALRQYFYFTIRRKPVILIKIMEV